MCDCKPNECQYQNAKDEAERLNAARLPLAFVGGEESQTAYRSAAATAGNLKRGCRLEQRKDGNEQP